MNTNICQQHGEEGPKLALIVLSQVRIPEEACWIDEQRRLAQECAECSICKGWAMLERLPASDQIVEVVATPLPDGDLNIAWNDWTGGSIYNATMSFGGGHIIVTRPSM